MGLNLNRYVSLTEKLSVKGNHSAHLFYNKKLQRGEGNYLNYFRKYLSVFISGRLNNHQWDYAGVPGRNFLQGQRFAIPTCLCYTINEFLPCRKMAEQCDIEFGG